MHAGHEYNCASWNQLQTSSAGYKLGIWVKLVGTIDLMKTEQMMTEESWKEGTGEHWDHHETETISNT